MRNYMSNRTIMRIPAVRCFVCITGILALSLVGSHADGQGTTTSPPTTTTSISSGSVTPPAIDPTATKAAQDALAALKAAIAQAQADIQTANSDISSVKAVLAALPGTAVAPVTPDCALPVTAVMKAIGDNKISTAWLQKLPDHDAALSADTDTINKAVNTLTQSQSNLTVQADIDGAKSQLIAAATVIVQLTTAKASYDMTIIAGATDATGTSIYKGLLTVYDYVNELMALLNSQITSNPLAVLAVNEVAAKVRPAIRAQLPNLQQIDTLYTAISLIPGQMAPINGLFSNESPAKLKTIAASQAAIRTSLQPIAETNMAAWLATVVNGVQSDTSTLNSDGLTLTDAMNKTPRDQTAVGKARTEFSNATQELDDLSSIGKSAQTLLSDWKMIFSFAVASATDQLGSLGKDQQLYSGAVTAFENVLVGSAENFKDERVKLFYYTDVARLMKALNDTSQFIDMSSAAASKAETDARNTLLDTEGSIIQLTVQKAQIAQQKQALEAQARQLQVKVGQAKQKVQQAKRQFDAATIQQSRAAAIQARQQQSITNLTSQQTQLTQTVASDKATVQSQNNTVIMAEQSLVTARNEPDSATKASDISNAQGQLAIQRQVLAQDTTKYNQDNAALQSVTNQITALQNAQTNTTVDSMAAQTQYNDRQADEQQAEQNLKTLQDEVDAIPAQVAQAQKDLESKILEYASAKYKANRLAENEAQAFADSRDHQGYWFALPEAASADPAKRVYLFGYDDSKTIYIRGLAADVEHVRDIIAQYDGPIPQARITLYTLQINSKVPNKSQIHSTKDNKDNLSDAIDKVDAAVRELRGNTLAIQEALRNSIILEVNRVARIAQEATSQKNAVPVFTSRMARSFYFVPEVRRQLGFTFAPNDDLVGLVTIRDDLQQSIDDFDLAMKAAKLIEDASTVPAKPDSRMKADAVNRRVRDNAVRSAYAHLMWAQREAGKSNKLVKPLDVIDTINEAFEACNRLTIDYTYMSAEPPNDYKQDEKIYLHMNNCSVTEARNKLALLVTKLNCLFNSKPEQPTPADALVRDAEYLTRWTLPDPVSTTTLGEMLFIASLGSYNSRQRIITEFELSAEALLSSSQASDNSQKHDNAQAITESSTTDKTNRGANTGTSDRARTTSLRKFVEAIRQANGIQVLGGNGSTSESDNSKVALFPNALLGSAEDNSTSTDKTLTANQREILTALLAKARESVSREVMHLINAIGLIQPADSAKSPLANDLRDQYMPLVGYLNNWHYHETTSSTDPWLISPEDVLDPAQVAYQLVNGQIGTQKLVRAKVPAEALTRISSLFEQAFPPKSPAPSNGPSPNNPPIPIKNSSPSTQTPLSLQSKRLARIAHDTFLLLQRREVYETELRHRADVAAEDALKAQASIDNTSHPSPALKYHVDALAKTCTRLLLAVEQAHVATEKAAAQADLTAAAAAASASAQSQADKIAAKTSGNGATSTQSDSAPGSSASPTDTAQQELKNTLAFVMNKLALNGQFPHETGAYWTNRDSIIASLGIDKYIDSSRRPPVGMAPTTPTESRKLQFEPSWYLKGMMAVNGFKAAVPNDAVAQDRSAWNIATLEHSRNSLGSATPRVAAADDMIKKLIGLAEGDIENFLIVDALKSLRTSVNFRDVSFGQLQQESILVSNRQVARIDPRATTNLGTTGTEDFLLQAQQLSEIVNHFKPAKPSDGGTGAALTNTRRTTLVPLLTAGTLAAARTSPSGMLWWGLVSGLLTDLAANNTPPPGKLYSINSGNAFQVSPVFDPSGQALRFKFDHSATTNILNPDGTAGTDPSSIDRHTVNTEVQLSNMEFRDISRYEVNSKVGIPAGKFGGLPLVKDLPVLRDIPIIGYYYKQNAIQAERQDSIIFAQTSIYPTVGDIVNLMTDIPPRAGIASDEPSYLTPASQASKTTSNVASIGVFPVASTAGSVTGTVTLDKVAGAGGVVITLSSDHPEAAIPFSTTVVVPQGQVAAQFHIDVRSVGDITPTIFTATAGTNSVMTGLVVHPVTAKSVQFASPAAKAGDTIAGTVTLTGPAPIGGATVLISADSSQVTVPAAVTVPAGQVAAPFTLKAQSLTAAATATITATYAGVAPQTEISIEKAPVKTPTPPAVTVSKLIPTQATVHSGDTITINVILNGAAPANGTTVNLTALAPIKSAKPTLTVKSGETSAQFSVTVGAVQSPVSSILTAKAGTGSAETVFTILPKAKPATPAKKAAATAKPKAGTAKTAPITPTKKTTTPSSPSKSAAGKPQPPSKAPSTPPDAAKKPTP